MSTDPRVLVVNGFDLDEPVPVIEGVEAELAARGHDVVRCDLAAEGFDATMSTAERAAYHSDDPLVTPETRAAADAVRTATGIVVCHPLTHGTCPPRVKSWQERVFVLGVGFEFLPSGVITGALHHLERALVIGVEAADGAPARRNGLAYARRGGGILGWPGRRSDHGPAFARSFHLSSNRRCRAHYLTVSAADPGRALRQLARW